MKRYGVEILNVKASKSTGGFRLIYDSTGNRTLDIIGVADKILTEDLPPECFESKAILLGPILQEIDLHLMKFLREKTDAKIFLDPQGMIREVDSNGRIREICKPEKAMALARLTDVIKPNEREAAVLTGVENPYTAVRVLIEWGAEISIVTLAERGSIAGKGRGLLRIPPYKTSAINPTGAGDTYIGAFIAKFFEGKSLFECAVFASATASIKVEHTGPDFPVSYAEASRRMNEILGIKKQD